MERLEAAIKDSKDALECINSRIAGESCDSLLDRISNAGTVGISQLKEMFERFDHMATNVTMLLVAIAIKNILFPIVFLMLAVKCSLPIARYASRLSCGFEEGTGKLGEKAVGDTEPLRATVGTTPRILIPLVVRNQKILSWQGAIGLR